MRRFDFHPEARLEARDVVTLLGRPFFQVLERCFDDLCELPFAWPAWPGRNDVRRRVLKKWPYTIVYGVDSTTVRIIALAHDKRRPGYWLPRL